MVLASFTLRGTSAYWLEYHFVIASNIRTRCVYRRKHKRLRILADDIIFTSIGILIRG